MKETVYFTEDELNDLKAGKELRLKGMRFRKEDAFQDFITRTFGVDEAAYSLADILDKRSVTTRTVGELIGEYVGSSTILHSPREVIRTLWERAGRPECL